MNDSTLQFKGNRFAEIILRFPCPQKILMVTDSSLNFGTAGFGLSEMQRSRGRSISPQPQWQS
ncbi:MAG: hypothetical protein HC866_09280 [Leptolyngbyaceae cyanobacterium RU_5_1]|nr:hypothetical protein [Leptolyngbyaceae cyanobacterium RU_5_1]